MDNIINVIFMLPALLVAVIFHEVAHGYIAYKLGDNTAKLEGRLTINPIPHIDPLGSIILPVLLLAVGSPFLFGWAKPVPINPFNFKKIDIRKGMAITALAGPITNFILAVIFAFLLKSFKNQEFVASLISIFGTGIIESIVLPILIFLKYAVMVNLILFIFNILPIPPLDGGRVIMSLVSPELERKLEPLEQYGFFIIILLLFLGIINKIIFPIYEFFMNILI